MLVYHILSFIRVHFSGFVASNAGRMRPSFGPRPIGASLGTHLLRHAVIGRCCRKRLENGAYFGSMSAFRRIICSGAWLALLATPKSVAVIALAISEDTTLTRDRCLVPSPAQATNELPVAFLGAHAFKPDFHIIAVLYPTTGIMASDDR